MFPTKKGNTKGDARAKVSLPKEMERGKEMPCIISTLLGEKQHCWNYSDFLFYEIIIFNRVFIFEHNIINLNFLCSCPFQGITD